MKRFNLSGWAVSHPTLILFLIVALSVAGFFSYQRLGRAEDPFFTVKVVNVSAIWPGATAAEMQTQVADPLEKKLQELPYFEKVQTYSKPSFTAMQVTFKDSTPPKDVPYLFYMLRKKLAVARFKQGVDIGALATALGAKAYRVEKPGEISKTLSAAIATVRGGQTAVVEVLTVRINGSLHHLWDENAKKGKGEALG